jgi:hypothetical protein
MGVLALGLKTLPLPGVELSGGGGGDEGFGEEEVEVEAAASPTLSFTCTTLQSSTQSTVRGTRAPVESQSWVMPTFTARRPVRLKEVGFFIREVVEVEFFLSFSSSDPAPLVFFSLLSPVDRNAISFFELSRHNVKLTAILEERRGAS